MKQKSWIATGWYRAILAGWMILVSGTIYADGLQMLIIRNQRTDGPADYSAMVRVSDTQPFIGGYITLPGSGNLPMLVQDGELIYMQSFPDLSSLNAAGWTAGSYQISGFYSSGSTNYAANIPTFYEYSFPSAVPLRLSDDSRRSVTPSFEINGDWSWFWITNSAGEEVFSTENTNNWMVEVDAGHALEHETTYTAIALTVWPWNNPYLGSASSLEFTTGFLDLDMDGLPDAWEQQIVDHNTEDAIATIEDVLARDDYDHDGFSNQAEFAGDLNPVATDSGVFNSVSEGLTLLADIFSSEDIHTGMIDLMDHCFTAAVTANPADYEARLYRAGSRLLNLVNAENLHSVLEQFGITLNAFLEPTGEANMATAPDINSMVDSEAEDLLPALEASLADLEVIPTNWTGSILISTNTFPLDESVYMDLADITFMKTALTLFSAFVRTTRANSLNLDYDALQLPVDGPVTTISIDGTTNDWAGIPVQLLGEQYSLISSVRAARSTSSLYLLIECRKALSGRDWQVSSELNIGPDQYASIWLNNENSWIGYEGTSTSGVNKAVSGKILELGIPMPAGVTASAIGVDELSLAIQGTYMWQSSVVSIPDNTPSETLLQNHPSFLQAIRSAADLSDARANFSDAIDYFLTADALASNRMDALMHFVEYDPTNAQERAEIIARIQEAQASLASAVQITVTNDLGEVEFDDRVHIGAFFEPAYLTRAMLPEFHRVLSQPLSGTFPDPTFGGILPDLAQTNLTTWLEEAIDDLDYDYLPNTWEKNFFNTITEAAADGDEDGDEFDNLQEYTCGSDPTNSASVFLFSGAWQNGSPNGTLMLQWNALPGRSYSIWYSTNLLNGFELLERGGFETGVYEAGDAPYHAFYRLEAELD